VTAWEFWIAPSSQARLLRLLQARRCGQTGGRLWRDAEVDIGSRCFESGVTIAMERWPKLLSYWELPDLQVINRDAHSAKCAIEARDRRVAGLILMERVRMSALCQKRTFA
jgi:hypothetical protein